MERDSHYSNYHQKPVYKTAYEIVRTTKAIVDSIDDQKDQWNLKNLMMQNAMTLPAKIAGAEAVELFSIKMENAVLIKIAARELQSHVSLCKQLQLNDYDYLNILDKEITDFREIYNEWVASFDPTVDIDDGWNVFK